MKIAVGHLVPFMEKERSSWKLIRRIIRRWIRSSSSSCTCISTSTCSFLRRRRIHQGPQFVAETVDRVREVDTVDLLAAAVAREVVTAAHHLHLVAEATDQLFNVLSAEEVHTSVDKAKAEEADTVTEEDLLLLLPVQIGASCRHCRFYRQSTTRAKGELQ